jgi:hypothetical protein
MGQVIHLQLGKKVGAVGFHCAGRQTQRPANFLVGQAFNNQTQHLAFPIRQLGIVLACVPVGLMTFARLHVLAYRVLQGFKQHVIVHRFLQKFCGTGLQLTDSGNR